MIGAHARAGDAAFSVRRSFREPAAGEGMDEQGEVTRLLGSANRGDPDALRSVLSLLHDRLREIAHRQLAHEGDGHTLETDGLVNEAYLRLLGIERVQWRDRQHLLAMAARTMRRVLLDYADRRRAQKRGGGVVPETLDEAVVGIDRHADELRALDEALERLERISPRQSRVVECRFFAGLGIEETATVLALSPATVKRVWIAARAWLNRELEA
jgi:RNA polymerase sigma factor (TIGR02999 family)